MEITNQGASTITFEFSTGNDYLFPSQNVFSIEMETIWVLMTILYNEENKQTKKDKQKEKRIGKIHWMPEWQYIILLPTA